MRFVRPSGDEVALGDTFTTETTDVETVTVAGAGEVDRALSLPYRGERLRGDALSRQLDTWVAGGVIEPSCADAVRAVVANPDWLDLSDQRVVVLGAGAEMGPTQSLLRWGADVIAVDLPRPAVWTRLLDVNRRYGGRLHVPARTGAEPLIERAGADLVHGLPDVAAWLLAVDGRLVLGNYVYADGATNVRVSMAVDALSAHLCAQRPDTALAFLATPTDTFAVPADAVDQAVRAYERKTTISRVRRPLRVISAGRLLRRNYAPGSESGDLRQPGAAAGPELRARETPATVACDGGSGGRHHGEFQGRPADADPFGAEEPGAGSGVRGRAHLRCRSLRTGHEQHADGDASRARSAESGRRRAAGASVAGRGLRRCSRRIVAGAVRAPKRARARGAARSRRCSGVALHES